MTETRARPEPPQQPPAPVRRSLLIEGDRHETRIALLEASKPVELFVERAGRAGVVGNVYKARVSRVLPGMQAAFLDAGLERDAFLYVGEVVDEPVEEAELATGTGASTTTPSATGCAPSSSASNPTATA